MKESEEEIRERAIEIVGELMAISARTAPKAAGKDSLEIILVTGEDKKKLAELMRKMAEERNIPNFIRDASGVEASSAVLLIGVWGDDTIGLNCGACGFEKCSELRKAEKKEGRDFRGPSCAYKIMDLGIALGSAVKTASILNVDNRIMYRIGAAARALGMAKSDVVMGIPLASAGKSPFFDR